MTLRRVSSYSSTNGSWVAIAETDDGAVHVRNSNRPDRGTLALSAEAVDAFVGACRAGELDDLTA